MTHLHRMAVLAALVLFPLGGIAPAGAHDYTLGTLKISHLWSRATVGTSRPGIGYLTITNTGTEADRLVGASSPAAARVHLHRSVMEGGVMKMEPVEALPIPAGGKVALAPGGYHLMLMGLKRPLAAGERLPVTLTFEKAGPIAVELHVEPLGAGGGMDMKGH